MLVGELGRFLFKALQTRFFSCTCFQRNTTFKRLLPLSSSVSKQSINDTENKLDGCYSSEQRSFILRVLNTASESELATVKLLRGRKSANIIEYRNKHGPLQDLQSLLKIPLFKYKTTVKVCDSILNPSERKEKKINVTKFIKPDVEREKLKNIKSIVSIVFGTRKIAWVHMDRNLMVLDWQQEESHRFMKGYYQPSVYFEEISSVVSQIPEADFFILEKPGISIQNTNLFPVTLHLRTVEAMLYALLDGKFMQDGQHKALSMVRTAVGKHFELMVGDSRTSGIEVVRQFMLDSVTQQQARVSFPRDIVLRYRNMFELGVREREEEMCDALLQAVAFYELAVFNEALSE
nr:PREDICTED: transcription elongation factor, mitochondrial isoform X2 [Latimeria chalumnae]|eukprot:XP_014342592.1 PREDICTED: transcription elongation factor, mitochondrial isoform X2 [Latimeria chalumnae]